VHAPATYQGNEPLGPDLNSLVRAAQANDEVTELDAIMYNKYTRQPEKLRAWQSASHPAKAGRSATGNENADSAHAHTT